MARRFQQRERPNYLNHVRCPECGVPMAERTRTRLHDDGEEAGSKFYGCARFPLCVGTRPIGLGLDSYSKLLQEAYSKALVFLSSPKFFGVNTASIWLLSKALEREEGDPATEDYEPGELDNSALERGIDAACAYLYEQHEIDHDFLVLAHEQRMESVRARLKFSTKPYTMRNMPKAQIERRYDIGTMEQFEASISTDWVNNGQHCPRCGQWAQEKNGLQTTAEARDWLDENYAAAMNEVKQEFTCTNCGPFTKVQDHYEYSNDAFDPMVVPGTTFQNYKRRKDNP